MQPTIQRAYFGPEYSDAESLDALDAEGLKAERPENLAEEVALLINNVKAVAGFNGMRAAGFR
ncbi:hypothetical protein [Rheinheimera sp. UJ63]|uniref:hypothetical protein n=1 Tax=Rheinheimera sp. UJ63 TaxID=2910157 RepID=UPI001F280892|nr:hypothetical protein [Rheinheimera sp. UJ63]MCF4007813.1 hypothetical protein [Rheinheimera sp. UJ63]